MHRRVWLAGACIFVTSLALATSVSWADVTVHSVKLNDGAFWGSQWTHYRSVSVHFWTDNATAYRVGQDSPASDWHACSSSDWANCALSGADGRKTVAIQFKADDGTTSDVIKRSITLDLTRPRVKRAVRCSSRSVAAFKVSASDNLSPTFTAEVVLKNLQGKTIDDQGSGLKWHPIAKPVEILCLAKAGTYYARFQVCDHAGNTSKWLVKKITIK